MKKTNVAVVGLGNMGRHHVRNYFEIEEANLVAVCDFNQEKADQYAKQFQCKSYTDLAELLDKESIDAINITASTSAHYAIAKLALSKGVHVFVEKPICDTVLKADELIKIAEEKSLTLMVGHIERFNPAVQKLKEIITDGKLGKITSLISRRVGVFPPQIKDANVVIDLAVHDIDIFNYLLDKQPDTVVGNAGRALIDGREDYAELFLTYGDQNGFIQVNWITPVRIRQLSITGTKGYAELNYMTQSLTFYESNINEEEDQAGDQVIKFAETTAEDIELDKKEPLKEELRHFLNCIQTQTQPLVHGDVGKQALEIALAAMKDMNVAYINS
ncbi:oxidoreductase [Candidatus Marinamargulisbacteria bacterium SCGC AG-414-C22]|nr:oxidoreductase [Candidatus Marinamargulisbacteria bacterium SCGC AG-414-C22]